MPGISLSNKTDVSITKPDDDKIVFIEVLSKTLVKTITKLYHILLLQLVYIRNVNKHITEAVEA